MSLFGIDVGSSSVKISAYSEEGRFLAGVKHDISPLHPAPGLWEQDPEEVWRAAARGLCELMRMELVRRDPPKALAISASGRENFPADEDGTPLGNNIMGADVRGSEFEAHPAGVPLHEAPLPEAWELSCGHLRERMDPVLRLLWWRKYHPEVIHKARGYPDWHGFLTQRLCGRNVSEPSLVARWLVYDLKTNAWSPERLAEYEIPPEFLPEVLPGGTAIGPVLRRVSDELGLPSDLVIVSGGHDLNCAGIGAGASRLGTACLISGSYENMLIPTTQFPTPSMLLRGLSITPHFGRIERSVYAICPTGNAVLNWARDTVSLSIAEFTEQLSRRGGDPSPVLALPYLSGAMLYWRGGRKLRGALIGLTLATQPAEIVQAFMESIAYDHVNTLSLLREEGVLVDQIRATGGGTRSEWWTQLKSDMMGVPIEVAAEEEPGTFGAALLAGLGVGVFSDIDEASSALSATSRTHQPSPERARLHQERLEQYRRFVPVLLGGIFEDWH
ncbi:MAG: hypothetical protein HPY55_03190 [Firmicutes bacterium]|nr:hypothetical protein [Bacillota bacterium]